MEGKDKVLILFSITLIVFIYRNNKAAPFTEYVCTIVLQESNQLGEDTQKGWVTTWRSPCYLFLLGYLLLFFLPLTSVSMHTTSFLVRFFFLKQLPSSIWKMQLSTILFYH